MIMIKIDGPCVTITIQKEIVDLIPCLIFYIVLTSSLMHCHCLLRYQDDNDDNDENDENNTCPPSWSRQPAVSRSLLRRESSIAANKEDQHHNHDDDEEEDDDDENDNENDEDYVGHLPLGLLLLVPAGHQLAQLLQVPRVVQLNLRSSSEDVLELNKLALLGLQPGVEASQLVVQLQSHICKSLASVSLLDIPLQNTCLVFLT